MHKHLLRSAGLALAATAAIALPAAAQQQENYDQASIEVLQEATKEAMAWAEGDFDYKGPEVTYDGDPILVRTSLHTPETAWSSKVWKWKFDALERMSGGKIKAEHHWGATIHHVSKGFEALRDNLTDATPAWSFYKANSFPMMQSLFLPGMTPNAAVHSIMAETLYDEYYREEYERQGAYLGAIRATTPYIVFSKEPYDSLDDLQGKKLRSGGGIQAAVLQALGATPISISSGEYYTAFQRGIIDAMTLSDGATEIFKIHEIATHRTYANLSRVVLEMGLRQGWVDDLPEDLRAVVNDWGRAAAQMDGQLSFMLHGAQARKTFKDGGMVFVELSDEEAQRWQEAAQPVIDQFVKDNEAEGRPAQKLVDDMRRLSEQYSKMTPNEIFLETVNEPIQGILPSS